MSKGGKSLLPTSLSAAINKTESENKLTERSSSTLPNQDSETKGHSRSAFSFLPTSIAQTTSSGTLPFHSSSTSSLESGNKHSTKDTMDKKAERY